MAKRMNRFERIATAVPFGIVAALGITACAPAENPSATASATPTPDNPSPSNGNQVETPSNTVTLETPFAQIEPLSAKEALRIPDELNADSLADASHQGSGAIYDKFREFMTLKNPETMNDEELAERAFDKFAQAYNAHRNMYLSGEYGDENQNISKEEIIDHCTEARNGVRGYPINGTMTETSKTACLQRYDLEQADVSYTKGNDFTGPRQNDKPYKQGLLYDADTIKVLSRSDNKVSFNVTQRNIRVTNEKVLFNAGLERYKNSDTTSVATYEVSVGVDGHISIKSIDTEDDSY